ncbi:Elongation factor Ts [bacterium HR35]|nr:Elongation factor Ts [bacterium HR35]
MDPVILEKIKILKEKTGAPIGKCLEALQNSDFDLTKAEEYLRKKGETLLEKKKEVKTSQGVIAAYVHFNGKIGSLIELKCETDFVAQNQDFKNLAYELAIQVAALKPLYASLEKIPQEILEEKRKEFLVGLENKPQEVQEEVFKGKLEKWLNEVCLLEQPYFRNENLKVKDLINEYVNRFGEKIEVGRFIRFALDE